MFPSSYSAEYTLESLSRKADQNPISKQPIFTTFPSPFFDEHELLSLSQMLSHDLQTGGSSVLIPHSYESHDLDGSKSSSPPVRPRSLGVVPRNRAGKKDRHSKICTAQGVRDRRMRLSLQVARKFFNLQDLLGYDKASKTIEWLFSKSKKAIKELTRDHPPQVKNNSVSDASKSESFISECEVLSGIEEISNTEIKVAPRNEESPLSSINKRSGRPKSQKMRESRDEARARARCRTREKRLWILSQWNRSNPNSNNYADIQKVLGSSNIPFEEANSDFQERVSSFHNLPDVGTIESLLRSWSNSRPNPYFECPAAPSVGSGNILGFLGNWDLLNDEKTNIASQYSNQASLVGNPNSPNFPFHQ